MIPLRGMSLSRRYLITSVSSKPYVGYYNMALNVKQSRWYSTRKDLSKVDSKDSKNKVSTDFMEVVKENTISAGYLVIIAAGLTLLIYISYTLLNELFSNNSPYGIYNRALKCCMKDSKVLDILGEPIKVHGGTGRRRSYFSSKSYITNGIEYMKIIFIMEGTRRKGVVIVEAKKVSSNYELEHIYMKVDNSFTNVLTIDHNEKYE